MDTLACHSVRKRILSLSFFARATMLLYICYDICTRHGEIDILQTRLYRPQLHMAAFCISEWQKRANANAIVERDRGKSSEQSYTDLRIE